MKEMERMQLHARLLLELGYASPYIFSKYWSQGITNNTVSISGPYVDNKLENLETHPETLDASHHRVAPCSLKHAAISSRP
jgi:hypothetical protein